MISNEIEEAQLPRSRTLAWRSGPTGKLSRYRAAAVLMAFMVMAAGLIVAVVPSGASASMLSTSECVDPEGDGWGWRGAWPAGGPCQTDCVDPEDDGWGWRGEWPNGESCEVRGGSAEVSVGNASPAPGSQTPATPPSLTSQSSPKAAEPSASSDSPWSETECIDLDDDGWGWIGIWPNGDSCEIVDYVAAPEPAPMPDHSATSVHDQPVESTETASEHMVGYIVDPSQLTEQDLAGATLLHVEIYRGAHESCPAAADTGSCEGYALVAAQTAQAVAPQPGSAPPNSVDQSEPLINPNGKLGRAIVVGSGKYGAKLGQSAWGFLGAQIGQVIGEVIGEALISVINAVYSWFTDGSEDQNDPSQQTDDPANDPMFDGELSHADNPALGPASNPASSGTNPSNAHLGGEVPGEDGDTGNNSSSTGGADGIGESGGSDSGNPGGGDSGGGDSGGSGSGSGDDGGDGGDFGGELG